VSTTFTVFFDGQFWVGVLEIHDAGKVQAARHVFGTEPTGPQLYEFGLHEFGDLLTAAESCEPAPASGRPRVNPKRIARLVARERAAPVVSTAAQNAMRLSIEARAKERRGRETS
jgi:hypothetical protein